MNLNGLSPLQIADLAWESYHVLFLASGFEARSPFLLSRIPPPVRSRCICLGFAEDTDKLSRAANDLVFVDAGVTPNVFGTPVEYEEHIRGALHAAASVAGSQALKIFVDVSVMTRAWYAYMLTWLRYAGIAHSADVDFAYTHGTYQGNFDHLQIQDIAAIGGFEGACAGARKTVAFFGLGFDRYATLAVSELIEADSLVCYVARDGDNDANSDYVLKQNSELIEQSGRPPIFLPLGDIREATNILTSEFGAVPADDEVIAVPMGPKTHVLATLLAAQGEPRVSCLHPRGKRASPVQVEASGRLSCWRAEYR